MDFHRFRDPRACARGPQVLLLKPCPPRRTERVMDSVPLSGRAAIALVVGPSIMRSRAVGN